jgi:plasmid stabilization system protein ParE
MRVILREAAYDDLDRIHAWIAKDRPRSAAFHSWVTQDERPERMSG